MRAGWPALTARSNFPADRLLCSLDRILLATDSSSSALSTLATKASKSVARRMLVVPLKGSRRALPAAAIPRRPRNVRGRPRSGLAAAATQHEDGLAMFLRDVDASVAAESQGSSSRAEDDTGGPSSQIFDPSHARRTAAAQHGSCRIGSVRVPEALQDNVQTVIDRVRYKSNIRTAAVGLYGHFRDTAKADRRLPWHSRSPANAAATTPSQDGQDRVIYNTLTSLAYTAGAMPSAYAATRRALDEVKRRWPERAVPPRRIFDWGCGTGSAGWAAKGTWAESVEEYVGIDRSSSMLWLAEELLGAKGQGARKPEEVLAELGESGQPAAWPMRTRFHKTSITIARKDSAPRPSRSEATFLESPFPVNLPTSDQPGDLAIMAFTLSDIPRSQARREAILALWNSGAETIVILDRGTPRGFQMVADAREQLLMLGRRGHMATTPHNEIEAGPSMRSEGSWVLAPCPHDGACPLHGTTNFCHFSQRLERPRFLRQTKHTARSDEDSMFSYVVIRRGQRPTSAATTMEGSAARPDGIDYVSLEASVEEGADLRAVDDVVRTQSLSWPRVILPPSKPKGHVILDVCAPSGTPTLSPAASR